jgi:UDP-N-acetylglucosamine 1-carboxyvinyltransferase
MTDWQAPWAILMTQCDGISTIHETVYEDRFGYVNELRKMGADIHFFAPQIKYPERVYNFNWSDKKTGFHQAIRIKGPTKLHNAVLEVADLRAGATMVLAALTAPGESVVLGIDHIDRGYENLDGGLRKLGAKIERKRE